MPSPTTEFYAALQRAFDFFNLRLFESSLPPCLITLRSASRVYGYHHADRFISPSGEKLDEIGLHPGFFSVRPVELVLSTLVHEMVHHWQHHFGTITPSNAHNQEWASKMESLGLMPSDTGLPGGKKTGRSMSHYLVPAGAYALCCAELVKTDFVLPWFDRHLPSAPEAQTQVIEQLQQAGVTTALSPTPLAQLPEPTDGETSVYLPQPKAVSAKRDRLSCPQCQARAWVTPGTRIMCGVCQQEMLT